MMEGVGRANPLAMAIGDEGCSSLDPALPLKLVLLCASDSSTVSTIQRSWMDVVDDFRQLRGRRSSGQSIVCGRMSVSQSTHRLSVRELVPVAEHFTCSRVVYADVGRCSIPLRVDIAVRLVRGDYIRSQELRKVMTFLART